jgi:hypothetical protein
MPPKVRLTLVGNTNSDGPSGGDLPPPEPPETPEPSPDLRVSVRAALAEMKWLTATDRALHDLAIRQAEEIEKAVDRGRVFDDIADDIAQLEVDDKTLRGIERRLSKLAAMCDITKTVGWLGPQLQGVLRDLGGTPGARTAMQVDKPIGSALEAIRKNAGR